jgi:hypothetical protein
LAALTINPTHLLQINITDKAIGLYWIMGPYLYTFVNWEILCQGKRKCQISHQFLLANDKTMIELMILALFISTILWENHKKIKY